MIASLTGVIREINPPELILAVGDIAYEMFCPLGVFYTHKAGDILTLYTHLSIKEDAHTLYGFSTKADKQLYRSLIKVNGIGPKVGLAILSHLSPTELMTAIEHEDDVLIAKTPGIGKKTAQKLILELKSSLSKMSASTSSGTVSKAKEALNSLGFSDKEISNMTANIDASLSVEEVIKQALQNK